MGMSSYFLSTLPQYILPIKNECSVNLYHILYTKSASGDVPLALYI